MKKRFLSLLAIAILVLVLGTTFVIFYIDQSISSLDDLVGRYEKERECATVLVAIKKVQQDGILHHAYGEVSRDAMKARVDDLGKKAAECSNCHHPESVAEKVHEFSRDVRAFQEVMADLFMDMDDPDHKILDVKAFAMGQELYTRAQDLFTKSSKQLALETNFARSSAVKSKWLLYIITCSGLVVVILITFLLIRSFTRPLQSLLTATKKIEQGDLGYRVHGLQHEFGDLANSFNAMSDSLQAQMLQLQRTEQLAACGKIATTLVHEVRNPLAGIKAAMELLSSESTISKEDREILFKVVGEVNRIEGLFTNMLDFARPKPPQLTQVSINEIVDRALLFTPDVTNQKVEVVWERDGLLPTIQADPNQLYQVFLNLFLNATAAMPQGGILTLVITADKEAEAINIAVSDSGSGIDEALLDDIFSPFFTTKPRGSGLGLATCKTLVELHNGSISAGNAPEGGALFQVTLPIFGGRIDAE